MSGNVIANQPPQKITSNNNIQITLADQKPTQEIAQNTQVLKEGERLQTKPSQVLEGAKGVQNEKKADRKIKRKKGPIRMKHEHIQTDYYNMFLGIEKQEQVPRPHYYNEIDLQCGDFVIAFPNPDHPDTQDFSITLTEAQRLFNKIFKFNIRSDRDKIKNKCFQRAFAIAFNQLQDCTHLYKKLKIPNVNVKNRKGSSKKRGASAIGLLDDLPLEFNKEKIGCNGGFLCEEEEVWLRTRQEAKDFLTLIRHALITKFTNEMGFHSRSFLSFDGKLIYCTFYADLENLLIIAEQTKFDKELQLGLCDLFSLEPVDNCLRPLRLHKFLNEAGPKFYRSRGKVSQAEKAELDILRSEINLFLNEIDFKRISYELSFKLLTNKDEEILDEDEVPIHVWRMFKEYLVFLAEEIKKVRESVFKGEVSEEIERMAKLERKPPGKKNPKPIYYKRQTKIIKRWNVEKLAEKYRKIFLGAYNVVSKPGILKNFWDRMNMFPMNPYTDYFNPSSEVNFKEKMNLIAFWRKYQVTETGKASMFLNIEKLKLIKRMIDSVCNLTLMRQLNLITQNFYLNDKYHLYGVSNLKRFKEFLEIRKKVLEEENIMHKERVNQGDAMANKKLGFSGVNNSQFIGKSGVTNTSPRKRLEEMEEQEENEEMRIINNNMVFIENNKLENINENLKKFETQYPKKGKHVDPVKILYDIHENTFFFQKLKILDQEWGFNLFKPWKIPVSAIRDYFGEKIALYFDFLSYYCSMLVPMALLGIPVFAVQFSDELNREENKGVKSDGFVVLTIIFSIINTIWSTLFVESWRRREIYFAIRFGQLESINEQELRPSFQGSMKRSIINDEMNDAIHSASSRLMYIIISFLLCLISWGIIFGVDIAVEMLMDYFEKSHVFIQIPYIEPDIFIPAIIMGLLVLILNAFCQKCFLYLTERENYKYSTDYESSFVIKSFICNVLGLSIPLLLIAFVGNSYDIYCDKCEASSSGTGLINCYGGDCFKQMQVYFRSLLYLLFFMNIAELAWPTFKFSYKETIRKFSMMIRKKEFPNRDNPYVKVNRYIEKEANKETYSINDDIDGTSDNFLEIIINFSLLSMFGVAFPLCFVISLFLILLEIRVDKKILVDFTQRPLPKNCSTIGSWITLMDLISYCSLLTNAGIISYTSGVVEKSKGSTGIDIRFIWLICLFIGNFFIKFMLKNIFQGMPENSRNITERHKNIIDKRFGGVGGKNKSISFDFWEKNKPIYKIFGTVLKSKSPVSPDNSRTDL